MPHRGPGRRPPLPVGADHGSEGGGGSQGMWGEVQTPIPGLQPHPELQNGKLELAPAPSLSVPLGLPQPRCTHPGDAQPWVLLKPKERRGGHERAPAGFIAQLGRGVQLSMGGQPGLRPPRMSHRVSHTPVPGAAIHCHPTGQICLSPAPSSPATSPSLLPALSTAPCHQHHISLSTFPTHHCRHRHPFLAHKS